MVDVEGGTKYTLDLGGVLVAEEKVRDQFEGNVVDLGAFLLIFLSCPTITTSSRIEVFYSRCDDHVFSSE